MAKQHGLRQKHSTETAVSELLGKLVETFVKKPKAIAVFIELRKAFDSYSIQHNILLSKLRVIWY